MKKRIVIKKLELIDLDWSMYIRIQYEFMCKNKFSGKESPTQLIIGHFLNKDNKMTSETYYYNPSTLTE